MKNSEQNTTSVLLLTNKAGVNPAYLPWMRDDDLTNRINGLRAYLWRQKKREEERRKKRKTEEPVDTYNAEVDLCYLEREAELREIRKKKHEEYVATLEPEEEEVEEDFDYDDIDLEDED